MADITTDDQIAEVISWTLFIEARGDRIDRSMAVVRELRERGFLITGLGPALQELAAFAGEAWNCPCYADLTISISDMHVYVRPSDWTRKEFVFGRGQTVPQCIEDARRQLQEIIDQRAREHADLCATIGITPDGRIIEQAA